MTTNFHLSRLRYTVVIALATCGLIATFLSVVPEEYVHRELLSSGRPALGLSVTNIATRDHGLRHGVRVVEVVKIGPAYTSGVRPSDVLLELDGTPISNIETLYSKLDSFRVGQNAVVTFVHNNRRIHTTMRALNALSLDSRACKKKDEYACSLLATLYSAGVDVEQNIALAKRLSTDACELGEQLGCVVVGERLLNERSYSEAFARLTEACARGMSIACAESGSLLFSGTGMAVDKAEAKHYVALGCEGGDAGACVSLAQIAHSATPVEDTSSIDSLEQACAWGYWNSCSLLHSNFEKAPNVSGFEEGLSRELDQSCKLADSYSCSLLGNFYEVGIGVALDLQQAVTHYRKSCDGKSLVGCDNLAMAYALGKGNLKKDEGAAMQLLDEGCAGGYCGSCYNLGDLSQNGTTKDYPKAVGAYFRACKAGNGFACANLGSLYFGGQGVVLDPSIGFSFEEQACALGAPSGCSRLGLALLAAQGHSPDSARGVQMLQKGCEEGDSWGCINLGLSYRDGQSVAKDISRAVELFKRACAFGSERGCALKELWTDSAN